MSSYKDTEKKISQELNKNKTPKEIFKKLRDTANIESLGLFLYLSGEYNCLLEYSAENLKKGNDIPWNAVLTTLIDNKIKINQLPLQLLFETWMQDYFKMEDSYYDSKTWPSFFDKVKNKKPESKKIIPKIKKEDHQKTSSKTKRAARDDFANEEDLLDQLEFARAQGLENEEQKIIEQLLQKDPNNPKYQELNQEFKHQNFTHLIQKQKVTSEKKERKFIPEKSEIKDRWVASLQMASDKSIEHTKEQAIFLAFLNWPDSALKILEKNLEDLSSYWLYLDWLLETGQYTISLDITNQLLMHLQSDPDSLLPLTYMKAQSLYHLGQKTEAIEHLKDIITVNPEYKSAQILLEEWSRS